jgi:hypothetical protein
MHRVPCFPGISHRLLVAGMPPGDVPVALLVFMLVQALTQLLPVSVAAVVGLVVLSRRTARRPEKWLLVWYTFLVTPRCIPVRGVRCDGGADA